MHKKLNNTCPPTVLRKIAFRTGKIIAYNPWNLDAEPGDKMIDYRGNVYRLEERGQDPELYPRKINPPGKRAVKINNIWYWIANQPLELTAKDSGKSD